MIALVAAVSMETRRLRSLLTQESSNQWRGRIDGTDVVLCHSGVGKANAASLCTELILKLQPTAMIMFGCGGAYPASGLQIGDLAMASEEIFGDEGSLTPDGFLDLEQMALPLVSRDGVVLYHRIPLAGGLSKRAYVSLADFCASKKRRQKQGAFVTVSTCSGTRSKGLDLERRTGGICENMEGAAAALVCHRHEIPLLELRGISNLVEDRNPAAWDLPAAIGIAQEAVLHLLTNWPAEGFSA